MITGNKCEVFAVADPAEWIGDRELFDDYIRSGMAAELAYDLATHMPVQVNISPTPDMKGSAKEEHKMTLFVFSEKEMEVHDEYIRKTIMYSLAADRCLNTLPKEAPCH